jgi:hypothetical protein
MSAAEVGASSRPPLAHELYAAARVIGNKCFDENLEFMKCKDRHGKDPAACAPQGTAVHTCVYALYKDIASKAAAEFKDYAACLVRAATARAARRAPPPARAPVCAPAPARRRRLRRCCRRRPRSPVCGSRRPLSPGPAALRLMCVSHMVAGWRRSSGRHVQEHAEGLRNGVLQRVGEPRVRAAMPWMVGIGVLYQPGD